MPVKLSKIVSSIKDYKSKLYLTDDLEIMEWKYILEGQHEFMPNCLYIGKASILKSILTSVKTNLILIEDCDILESDLKESVSNIILLNKDCDLHLIFNHIQRIFIDQQRLGDCTIKILKACQQGYTTQQLLDLGYQMLQNPLLLVDISLCLIAHSGGNNIKNEPLWEWTLSKGYVTKDYVQSVMLPNEKASISKSVDDSLFFWNDGLLSHRQLVGRVVHDNKPMSYLKLMEYNKPITECDEQILVMLCNFLALTMKDPNITKDSSNTLIDSFLTALLNEKIYDHDAIDERTRLFGLKLYENMFIMTIEVEDLSKNNDRLYYLKRIFQNFFNRQTILIYNGQIVILLDTITKEIFTENALSSFEDLLRKNNCTAGVSQIFYHLYDLPEYYKQSKICLYLGDLLHKREPILRYDDYIIPHMILKFQGETNIQNLIHPVVTQLKEMDEKKGTDFLKTLLTHINNNQNMTLTSKALHLHYNTVKYRIKRIEDFTNIDFTNSETLFHICLSSKVLEIMDCL